MDKQMKNKTSKSKSFRVDSDMDSHMAILSYRFKLSESEITRRAVKLIIEKQDDLFIQTLLSRDKDFHKVMSEHEGCDYPE